MTDACCSCEDIKKIIKEEFGKAVEELKATRPAGRRAKRAPSKDNIFIGKCMKQDGKNMKICAAEYKKEKKAS